MDLDFATVFKKSGPWQYNHDQSRVCADEEQALPRLLRLSLLRFVSNPPSSPPTFHKQPFHPPSLTTPPPPSLGWKGRDRALPSREERKRRGQRCLLFRRIIRFRIVVPFFGPFDGRRQQTKKIKRSSGECVSHHPPHPPPHHTARNKSVHHPFGPPPREGGGGVGGVVIVDRVDDQERESAEREEAAGIKPNGSREANAHRRAASEENAIENAFGCFFVVCGKADIIS